MRRPYVHMRTLAVLATLAVSVATPILLVGSGALENVIGGGTTPAPVEIERVDAPATGSPASPRRVSPPRADADDGARALTSDTPFAGARNGADPGSGPKPTRRSQIPPSRTPVPSSPGGTTTPPRTGGVTPPVIITPPVVTPPVVTPPVVTPPSVTPPRVEPPQVNTPKPPLGSIPRPTVPVPPPRQPIERAGEVAESLPAAVGGVTDAPPAVAEAVEQVVPAATAGLPGG